MADGSIAGGAATGRAEAPKSPPFPPPGDPGRGAGPAGDEVGVKEAFQGFGRGLSERLKTQKLASWTNGSDGYDGLSERQREQAERNFRLWTATHPQEAQGLDVHDHVARIQKEHAEREARARAGLTGVPASAGAAARPAVSAPAATGTTDPKEGAAHDSIRGLLDKLERVRPGMERVDPALAAGIKSVVAAAQAPGALEDAKLRTRIAYGLQDVEKRFGPVSGVPQDLRDELSRLARTYPGLRHEGMQELLRATPGIADRGLVRDIRATAASLAADREQDSPDAQSRVDVLANRARLARRAEAPAAATEGASTRGATVLDKTKYAPRDAGGAEAPGPDAAARDEGAKRGPGTPHPAKTEAATGPATVPPAPAAAAPADRQQPPAAMQQLGGAGATVAIMAALRRPEATEQGSPAPWDRQLTPLGDRLAGFVERSRANGEEATLRAAERSGEAAARALQAFAAGQGAPIMGKIEAAAKSDAHGMTGVIAGMREGGAYQDLRREFNADLGREKALAAALDKAAAAVGRYGTDRVAADAAAATRSNAAAVTARFEKLDAEVGQAAASTPSRNEGKSQLGDLADKFGDKVAEIAKKAAEAIRSAFQRDPAAAARPSGPSTSP